jgi:hypothetical protein
VPSPTQSSWVANLFTPKEPTPTISFTNIPMTEKKGFNVKDLVCREESVSNNMLRGVFTLPQLFFSMLKTLDTSIESGVNKWLENLHKRN